MRIYGLYDAEGNQVDQGSAAELGERYFVSVSTIHHAAIYHHRLLTKYEVREVGREHADKVKEKREIIKSLHDKGRSVIQISVETGINECTVGKYLHDMRKEGVIQ